MAIISSLNTEDPRVALIVAAHNAAALSWQGQGDENDDRSARLYIQRFRQIYAALQETAGYGKTAKGA